MKGTVQYCSIVVVQAISIGQVCHSWWQTSSTTTLILSCVIGTSWGRPLPEARSVWTVLSIFIISFSLACHVFAHHQSIPAISTLSRRITHHTDAVNVNLYATMIQVTLILLSNTEMKDFINLPPLKYYSHIYCIIVLFSWLCWVQTV